MKQIDKLKASLSNCRKEADRASSQTEQLVAAKQSVVESLQEKRSQLALMYDNANAHAEILKKSELAVQAIAEEKQKIELKVRGGLSGFFLCSLRCVVC